MYVSMYVCTQTVKTQTPLLLNNTWNSNLIGWPLAFQDQLLLPLLVTNLDGICFHNRRLGPGFTPSRI